MRPLATIKAEIGQHERALDRLRKEARDALRERDRGIVKGFDDGATRPQLCQAFSTTYEIVANVLAKARRTERSRIRLGMDERQMRRFERLVDDGIRPRIAKRIVMESGVART